MNRGRRRPLGRARVVTALRRVGIRHDQVALRAVDVHYQPSVRVVIDHPVEMVPEYELRCLRGSHQPAHQSQTTAAHYIQVRRAEDFRFHLCDANPTTVTERRKDKMKKTKTKRIRTNSVVSLFVSKRDHTTHVGRVVFHKTDRSYIRVDLVFLFDVRENNGLFFDRLNYLRVYSSF